MHPGGAQALEHALPAQRGGEEVGLAEEFQPTTMFRRQPPSQKPRAATATPPRCRRTVRSGP